jgi:hypothetical protein
MPYMPPIGRPSFAIAAPKISAKIVELRPYQSRLYIRALIKRDELQITYRFKVYAPIRSIEIKNFGTFSNYCVQISSSACLTGFLNQRCRKFRIFSQAVSEFTEYYTVLKQRHMINRAYRLNMRKVVLTKLAIININVILLNAIEVMSVISGLHLNVFLVVKYTYSISKYSLYPLLYQDRHRSLTRMNDRPIATACYNYAICN